MITLENINFAYTRNRPVLEDIDMQLSAGQIYGLLGKNGEGKTTLLNLLSGQLFPASGKCTILNNTPSERKVNFLQQIFVLPEEIKLPEVTANEYIEMFAPFYPTFRKDIWENCFETFEVNRKDSLSKMSMGQKKKVAISMALAAHTPLLLMDEPTNALDIPSKAVFRKLVASCLDEEQTVIISTHQVRDLESLIDSVIILENHRILLNASLEEIMDKLFFRAVTSEDKILYSEASPSGLIGVGVNTNNEKTPVSLELLFQAVTQNPGEIKEIFNK